MKPSDDQPTPTAGDGAASATDPELREAELRHSVEAERSRASELAAVLDTVPVAVWIARDPRGDRIDANRLGAELLRRPRGRNVSLTAPADDGPQNFVVKREGRTLEPDELPIQRAARYGEEVRDWDEEVWFDDGTVMHLVGNVSPIRDAHGRVKGSVGAFLDVTARREAELALERREAELREADRRKNEFLAVLSHELRNPLAAIRQSLAVLERGPGDGAAAARARAVLGRQERLLSRLVDDLLDVGRITHGRIELRLARIDARAVVQGACMDHQLLFDEHGVTLEVEVGGEPLWVEADGARLAQMVGNLLHNALKYTPRGGRVVVTARRRGDEVEVVVRDTGVGLEPEQLERIFEPFVQVAPSRGAQAGLGLGLALVRELATRQRGRVGVQSDGLGQGAEFLIALPEAGAGESEDASRRTAQHGGAPLSLLLIEDNDDAAQTLADLLRLEGHRVRTAATGRAGISAVDEEWPDVLICDIGLPDLSGYEVMRAVRAAHGDRRPFSIALSGYARPEDIEAAHAAGFDAHVGKPPPIELLGRLLRRAAAS